jgi:sugar lactone lactonase YvrE
MATGTDRTRADASVVVAAGNLLGESPVWDAAHDALWWIDIHGRSVHRWTPRHGHGAWPLAEQVGCIGLCEGGGLVAGTRSGFVRLDPASGRREPIADVLSGRPDVRFNDGRADRHGAFWSGTVHERREVGGAALYRLAPDGTVRVACANVTVSNGIAWSPDGRTMYFADSHVREVYAFDVDPATGLVAERRLLLRFDPEWGMPDGATVDAEGHLWIAGIGGACVLRIRPDGVLDRRLGMPVSQPTSCTFGGPGLRTLYVTSARMKLDDAGLAREPLAGSVFALDTGVAGLPEPSYRGPAR